MNIKKFISNANQFIKKTINESQSATHRFSDFFSNTLEKAKDFCKTNYELGLEHIDKGNYADARLRFWLCCTIQKDRYPKAYYYLARIAWRNRKIKKSRKYIDIAYKSLSKDPEVTYLYARLNSPETISYIPLSILQENFNNVADTYNELYVNYLQYIGHLYLARIFKNTINTLTNNRVDVLDLGCGTGLVGQALTEYKLTRFIDGVDLSPNMLQHARMLSNNDEEPLYNSLAESDIISYLQSLPQTYDAIVCCHGVNYFGDISQLLTHCHAHLNQYGVFIFTANIAQNITQDYVIEKQADSFLHKADYIDTQVSSAGLVKTHEAQFKITNNAIATLYVVQKQ